MVVRITGKPQFEDDDDGLGAGGAIPRKYNRDSKELREVEPNGDHVFDFSLQS